MKHDPVIVWSKRSRWKPHKLIHSLQKILQGRVKKAFLFGSHAENTATEDSDIDLILVTATRLPWPDRPRLFFDLREKYGTVDLLVYTPEEWKKLFHQPSVFIQHSKALWKKIL